jgi:hypothetical protein
MEGVLKARGYTAFILLDVEDIKWVAIDVLNALTGGLRRIRRLKSAFSTMRSTSSTTYRPSN